LSRRQQRSSAKRNNEAGDGGGVKKRSAARGHPPEPVWHTGMAAAVVEGDGEPQTHTSSRRRRSWCGRAAMGVVVEEKVSWCSMWRLRGKASHARVCDYLQVTC